MPNLRVIILQEVSPKRLGGEAIFTAICLEHFVVSQGPSVRDALDAFDRLYSTAVCVADMDNTLPFTGIGPAPKQLHEMYELAKVSGFVIQRANNDQGKHVSAVVSIAA